MGLTDHLFLTVADARVWTQHNHGKPTLENCALFIYPYQICKNTNSADIEWWVGVDMGSGRRHGRRDARNPIFERLGGNIRVESEEGRGATFLFTLRDNSTVV